MNRVETGSLALSGFYNATPTERAVTSLSLSVFNCCALCRLQQFLPPLVGIMQERRHQMIGNSPILPSSPSLPTPVPVSLTAAEHINL